MSFTINNVHRVDNDYPNQLEFEYTLTNCLGKRYRVVRSINNRAGLQYLDGKITLLQIAKISEKYDRHPYKYRESTFRGLFTRIFCYAPLVSKTPVTPLFKHIAQKLNIAQRALE